MTDTVTAVMVEMLCCYTTYVLYNNVPANNIIIFNRCTLVLDTGVPCRNKEYKYTISPIGTGRSPGIPGIQQLESACANECVRNDDDVRAPVVRTGRNANTD